MSEVGVTDPSIASMRSKIIDSAIETADRAKAAAGNAAGGLTQIAKDATGLTGGLAVAREARDAGANRLQQLRDGMAATAVHFMYPSVAGIVETDNTHGGVPGAAIGIGGVLDSLGAGAAALGGSAVIGTGGSLAEASAVALGSKAVVNAVTRAALRR